jgi:superoxide dismutase, Fe-Mn family
MGYYYGELNGYIHQIWHKSNFYFTILRDKEYTKLFEYQNRYGGKITMEHNLLAIPAGQHQLPHLPYQYNALEPIISATTLRYHHDIHHKTYVDDLNKVELKLVDARRSKDFDMIKCLENNLAFNGSGHLLHSIFWTIMAPMNIGGTPGAQTIIQINRYFEDFSAFQQQFSNAALKVEGSGWAVLVWHPAWNRLEILQA